MNKSPRSMTILDMPKWKSKVLNAVAWILGMRGEHVACITFNFDYTDLNVLRKISNDACEDCSSDSCKVCN